MGAFPAMNKTMGMLAGVALLVGCGAGQAATFTQSDFAGTGNFGTATATCLGRRLRSGWRQRSTWPRTSLLADRLALPVQFELGWIGIHRRYVDPTDGWHQYRRCWIIPLPPVITNGPFKFFSDGISADCGNGGSSGCGSTLSFHYRRLQRLPVCNPTVQRPEHHRGGRRSADRLRGWHALAPLD